jgi:hypothetical protein
MINSIIIYLNLGPGTFIFGDMWVQSWHFIRKIHKILEFKNSIRVFCLLWGSKFQKIRQ